MKTNVSHRNSANSVMIQKMEITVMHSKYLTRMKFSNKSENRSTKFEIPEAKMSISPKLKR